MQKHTTVLLHEAIEGLNLNAGDTVIDATLGLGGHTEMLADVVGKTGTVLAFDLDQNAINAAKKRLSDKKTTIHYVHGNFRDMDMYAKELQITQIHGILFDLGWNATQLESGRGFSFMRDEPLVMTLQDTPEEDAVTAETIVNTWSEQDLVDIIRTIGEEQFAKRIVQAIVRERTQERIKTSGQLAQIVHDAVPVFYRNRKTHPATKTFQALRIVVNNELSTLTTALEKSIALLSQKGRIAVITFHSLEDGLVKRLFKQQVQAGTIALVNKKPLTPTKEEITSNPRARSAKLRIIEKL